MAFFFLHITGKSCCCCCFCLAGSVFFIIFPLFLSSQNATYHCLYDFFFSSLFTCNVLRAVKESENDVRRFQSQGYDLNHTFKHPEILHFPAQSLIIFNKYFLLFMILNVNSICMNASVHRYFHIFFI